MPRSHMSPKKVEMEGRKRAKQQERLLRQGRIRPGKSAGQKELEKIMKPQQAVEPSLELKRIGTGWFPEMKNADLRILAGGNLVKKGNLEFRPMPRFTSLSRVSFIVVRQEPDHNKTALGSFSVDLELKTIKRF